MAWLVAAVHALAFGRLTILEAFNAVVLGSFVAFPLAVVFLAGSFGLGWRAAGIAAVLALVVSYALGNGLEGLFGVGLVENTVGAIFVALALGAMVRVAAEPRTSWVLLAGVSLAVLVLTHLVCRSASAVVARGTAALWGAGSRARSVLARPVARASGPAR
jgi:hypothetical protein